MSLEDIFLELTREEPAPPESSDEGFEEDPDEIQPVDGMEG
jgi:hypothetical protein